MIIISADTAIAAMDLVKKRRLENFISVQQGDIHTFTVDDLKTMNPDIIETTAAAETLFSVKIMLLAKLANIEHVLCNKCHIKDAKVSLLFIISSLFLLQESAIITTFL